MPIKRFPRYAMRPAELAGMAVELDAITKKIPAGAPLLPEVQTDLSAIVVNLVDRVGEKARNIFTGPLFETDEERDTTHTGLRWLIKGLCYHLDPEVASAARIIYPLFEKHDTQLADLPYQEESLHLKALIADMKAPEILAQLQKLGLEQQFNKLVSVQERFDQLSEERTNANAANNLPPLSQFVAPIRRCFNEMFRVIDILERRDQAVFGPIVEEINQLINQQTAKVRHRMTRKANEESPAQPDQPATVSVIPAK